MNPRGSVPLGRIAGVEVRAHWSLIVILVLVAEGLATSLLPAMVKGASATSYWLVGVTVAVLFLLSLLAHEVSHAVVAQRHGIRVEGITLWMLGGITALEDTPRDASTDLRTALAGPLVSIGCGLVAVAAAAGLSAVHAPREVVAGALWLGATNGLLAVFNLLPGAPLDGGRILRAVLWRRSGDQDAAETTAARVGRATGLVLVALGFLDVVVASDLLGGLWLMLVGWFLRSAATLEMQGTTTRQSLGRLRVSDVMETELTWLPAYHPAAAAAARAVEDGRDWCLVCDMEGRPLGIVAVDRLVEAAVHSAQALRVADVMVPLGPRIITHPDELLADAVIRAGLGVPLVVFDAERVVGIVTPRRTARALRRGRLSAATAAATPAASS